MRDFEKEMAKSIREMEQQAKLAEAQMSLEQQNELAEFDRLQRNVDARWRKHRDDRELIASEDEDEATESAETNDLDMDIHYIFPQPPTYKELKEQLGEIEAFRRRDSWYQISAKQCPQKPDKSLVWLDQIYSQTADGLGQLMEDGKLTKAIEQLTNLQREVLFLHYVKRYTIDEIAEMLGSSPRNIRKRRQTALEKVRTIYNGI